VVFRHLPASEREEAVAEAVAAGFASFIRLKAKGKELSAYPSTLAEYAVLHVKSCRHIGTKLNSRDVLSKAAQQTKGFAVRSLSQQQQEWNDILADDNVTPIPDLVSFRIDWAAFLATLSQRHRLIVHYLALGHAPKWVASKFGVSPGRITQLRQRWRTEWHVFQGDTVDEKVPQESPR
jgi:hypothetical protein